MRPWLAALVVALLAGALIALWRDREAPPAPGIPQPPPVPPAEERLDPSPTRLPASEHAPRAPVAPRPLPAEPARPSGEPEEPPGDAVTRAMVREVLEETFQTHIPEERLSPEQYERLADAVLRIRRARRSLAELPLSQENAETVHRLRQELTDALTEFQEIAGLPPDEFTDRVQPDVGLDHGSAEGEDVVFEELPEPPPPE